MDYVVVCITVYVCVVKKDLRDIWKKVIMEGNLNLSAWIYVMSHTFHFYPSIHKCRVHVSAPPSTRLRTSPRCSKCTCPSPLPCHCCSHPGNETNSSSSSNLPPPHIWPPIACRSTGPCPVCDRPPSHPRTCTYPSLLTHVSWHITTYSFFLEIINRGNF